jgi:hypothetical protein
VSGAHYQEVTLKVDIDKVVEHFRAGLAQISLREHAGATDCSPQRAGPPCRLEEGLHVLWLGYVGSHGNGPVLSGQGLNFVYPLGQVAGDNSPVPRQGNGKLPADPAGCARHHYDLFGIFTRHNRSPSRL